MVMKKEEKIKQAWIEILGSENYQSVLKNNEFKENGWRSVSGLPMYAEEVYDILKYKSNLFSIRPKSLKGIDNNNGWVKIESEYDLPRESGQYFVNYKYKIEVGFYHLHYKKWFCSGQYYSDTHQNIGITHYQPIQKPQPPIY